MEETPPTDQEAWEEIDVNEVERILAAISELMEATTSENIQAILESACCDLAALVGEGAEDDEDETDGDDQLAAAA